VRRLVTCNTPHAGSQTANRALDELWGPIGVGCEALEGLMRRSCYRGAACDLNVCSHGVNNLLNNGITSPEVRVCALPPEPPRITKTPVRRRIARP
jgi:hypothetical protein